MSLPSRLRTKTATNSWNHKWITSAVCRTLKSPTKWPTPEPSSPEHRSDRSDRTTTSVLFQPWEAIGSSPNRTSKVKKRPKSCHLCRKCKASSSSRLLSCNNITARTRSRSFSRSTGSTICKVSTAFYPRARRNTKMQDWSSAWSVWSSSASSRPTSRSRLFASVYCRKCWRSMLRVNLSPSLAICRMTLIR